MTGIWDDLGWTWLVVAIGCGVSCLTLCVHELREKRRSWPRARTNTRRKRCGR